MKKPKIKNNNVRIFSKNNYSNFAKFLQEADWEPVHLNSDVNVAYNNFTDILQSGFDQCFPLKRLSRRKANDKVWITKALIKSSKVKARLYKNGFQLGDFVVKQNIKITKKNIQESC